MVINLQNNCTEIGGSCKVAGSLECIGDISSTGTVSCQGLNVNNVSVQILINHATSRDNLTFTGHRITITGDSPTIHLKYTNTTNAFIHCNDDKLYFLNENPPFQLAALEPQPSTSNYNSISSIHKPSILPSKTVTPRPLNP